MRTSLSTLLASLPGAPSVQWPGGERYALGFEHGTLSLGCYAPAGADHRFENFTEGFAAWVVFWGPPGGET